ncbi:MAG: MBL fold metallo-hydrolase [Planctomycetaceae bacterium]|nr:MAG: MBL fold metallo-hydrolase [Planctomycetaceae bacterium]
MKVHHLNCGILHAPPGPRAACHCLLLEHDGRLALIDTGIGLQDIAHPLERIGQPAIDAAGFQFHERLTAARQLERFGFRAADVTDIVLTHGDPDHAGGLADFPAAAVHVSTEEHARLASGLSRYSPAQFAHRPQWVCHPTSTGRWFGAEARPLPPLAGAEAFLIPLFGHTLGHCGVAVRSGGQWLLHVGDAYYLRVELSTDDHPVSALAAMRADDDALRRESLAVLRRIEREHGGQVQMFGYHDFTEFPPGSVPDVEPGTAADGVAR